MSRLTTLMEGAVFQIQSLNSIMTCLLFTPVNTQESDSRGEPLLPKINNISVPTGAEGPHPGGSNCPTGHLSPRLLFCTSTQHTTVRKQQLRKPPLPILEKAQQFSTNYLCPSRWKKNPFLKNAERENKFVTGQGKAPGFPLALPASSPGFACLTSAVTLA